MCVFICGRSTCICMGLEDVDVQVRVYMYREENTGLCIPGKGEGNVYMCIVCECVA